MGSRAGQAGQSGSQAAQAARAASAGLIRCGVEEIAFEEPDLATPVPSCVDPVAGLLMCGHWLKEPPNFEDVVTGCTRLPQFRDARRSRLVREVRWHFISRFRPIALAGGEPMTPGQWLTRWNEDPVFQRLVRDADRYREWRDGLALKLRAAAKCVLAVEDTRVAYARVDRCDPVQAAAMHRFMEEGGI